MGSDQDHPQRPASLRNVEKHLFDRAGSLTRCVLVQFVEHDHQKLFTLTSFLLLLEGPSEGDADDKPLGPIVEVVQVHHGDLTPIAIDAMTFGIGDIGSDQPAQMTHRPLQSPNECVDRSGAHCRPGPLVALIFGLDPVGDEIGQFPEGPHSHAVDDHSPAVVRLDLAELGHDVVDHGGVLSTIVLGIREQEGEEILGTELVDAPEEGSDVGA